MLSPEPPDFIDTAFRAGLALIPGVGGAVQVVYGDVRARIAHRQWQTVQGVAEAVGPNQLGARLEEDPLLQAIFVAGVEAATKTGLESKRRLLARTVAAAALDKAKVDESQLCVEALRDLDGPHIAALARLETVDDECRRGEPGTPTHQQYRTRLIPVWFGEPLAVRAALVRTGVAIEPSMTLMASHIPEGISEFGRKILTDLRSFGGDN